MSQQISIAKRVVLPIVVIALVVAAGVWLVRPRPAPRDDEPSEPPLVADPEQLIRTKNRAVAQLENGEYEACDPLFGEIAERLPDEPLGPRNLVIARLLQLEQFDRQRQAAEFETAVERLLQAVEQLQARDSDDPVNEILAGRAAALSGDAVRARQALTKATELSPNDPSVWFELSTFDRNSDNPEDRKKSQAALREAYRLEPANLSLLIEWLLVQAESRDADIRETLQSARTVLEPLAGTVRQQSRVDVLKLLDDATTAAGAADWNAALRQVRVVTNVVRPDEAVQSDRRRVSRHPLEYALLDYRPQFYESSRSREPAEASPFEVRFEQAGPEKQPPAAEQVRALAAVDFDLDGTSDVILLCDAAVEAYGRTEPAGPWQLLARAEIAAGARGLLTADLDGDAENMGVVPEKKENRSDGSPAPKSGLAKESASRSRPTSATDADLDVVVFGEAGVLVLENSRDPTTGRQMLIPSAQSDDFAALRGVWTVAAADLDHDGDLDLVVSTPEGLSLWSNRGDRTFENISTRARLPPADFEVTAILPLDWDRDVDTDLLLAGRPAPVVGLLENVRHGRFRWRGMETSLPDLRASALVPLDVDGNVAWDFVVAGQGGARLQRTAMSTSGAVEQLPVEVVSSTGFTGMVAGDMDNDGSIDLAGRNGEEITILRGLPGGRFESLKAIVPATDRPIRDIALADVDGDGDDDLWVATPTRATWFRNEGGNRNHWIDVALKAAQIKGNQRSASGRVNHYGVGSLLELKAGLSYQARVVNGQSTHFGLGTRDKADVLRVLWTNGVPHDILEPNADQTIFEQQTLKGSCPYLYTWTGSRFEFSTDLLWAAPIGLQFGEGIIAPAREWEYLKIAGESLHATGGEYRLQITEELWEAAYFDCVKLLAVDHPADFEVFTNEKVGPAEIAEFRVHTVRQRRPPAAARDQRGRDVLPEVMAEDGRYLKAFDRKLRQGLTEEHYLELDLGRLESPERLTLFLAGWVYPTDTSINVALSQDPRLAAPKPPSLWVPAENGEWREALPFMGFPGGKTKTIAVDLTGLFPTEDYRVRIVTSMEIYWDSAFFSVDEAPLPHELRELPLVSAGLRYRGFSRRVPHPENGPEFYDYTQVSTAPRWPPLDGRYTRYGDVLELVSTEDDRLVVLGAGDELSLAFAAPQEPLPPGWKRDFFLYNVGWDKDADINTVYGQSVEPLPFRAMGRYPFPEGVLAPDDSPYRKYLEQYQTREQTRRIFWHGIRRFEPIPPASHRAP